MKKLMLRYASVIAIVLFSSQAVNAAKIEDKIKEISAFQKQEDQIMLDYQKKKRALEAVFQQQLNDLGNSKEKEAARAQLVQDTKKKQEDLKNEFQSQLREIQKKERKLRTGREDMGSVFYQDQQQQMQKDMLSKKQRQDLLRKQQSANASANRPVAAYQEPADSSVTTPTTSITTPPASDDSSGLQHNRVRFRDPTQKTLDGAFKDQKY